jgi:molybdopterin/thiamine biosynthesis adenylyltransferase
MNLLELNDRDRALYEWQMWVPGMGELGQRKLKSASVLISRVGGLGGLVALELAAAGIGRLILAHGGDLQMSDLNRQLLQTRAQVGRPRVESMIRKLADLNPDCEVIAVPENVTELNADALVAQADIVVDAAPLFQERLALNAAAVRARKPMVECAMHSLEGDARLRPLVETAKGSPEQDVWRYCAEGFKHRTLRSVMRRAIRLLHPSNHKGEFSEEERALVVQLVGLAGK